MFSERPGPTSYCHKYIAHSSPYSAFCLFIDEHILKYVQKHTRSTTEKLMIAISLCTSINWRVSLVSNLLKVSWLEEILGIKHLRNKDWEQLIFQNTMSRERYAKIMKHLSFDDFQRRRQRRETDKFCLNSEVWNSFIENCKKCCVRNFDLTIDEQLFS